MKEALGCLFPPLAAIWDTSMWNTIIVPGNGEEWQRQRRACSPEHFDTYFRSSLLPETISSAVVQEIIENSGDISYVKNKLMQVSQTQKRNKNGTYASLLDELHVHAQRIPIENAEAFLSGLFSVHDKIDTEIDPSYNFMIMSKIYLLLENLLLKRTDLDKRSAIIIDAIRFANLYLTIFITIRTRLKYHPPQEGVSEPENKCLITKSDMEDLCKMSAAKIKTAVEHDKLLDFRKPLYLLFCWSLLARSDQSEKAKSWCMSKLKDDNAVEIFAKELTKELTPGAVYSASIISYPIYKDNMSILKRFFDVNKFNQRVKEVLRASQRGSKRYVTLQRFMNAFNEH